MRSGSGRITDYTPPFDLSTLSTPEQSSCQCCDRSHPGMLWQGRLEGLGAAIVGVVACREIVQYAMQSATLWLQ